MGTNVNKHENAEKIISVNKEGKITFWKRRYRQ